MTLHWPQITWIIMVAMSIGLHLANHGEPVEQKYNFFWRILYAGFSFWILFSGGFFGN